MLYNAFLSSGGRSFGCPENSGAAGTFYDAVPKSLFVNNHNFSTETDTLLLEFPNQPLWTNVFVKNCAKVVVPLLWSRVQVSFWFLCFISCCAVNNCMVFECDHVLDACLFCCTFSC